MKKSFIALLPALALLFVGVGCDEGARSDTTASKSGIWSGFIFNGKTAAKINFFDTDTETTNSKDDNSATNQVWVLADGDIVSAKPCGTEEKDVGLQAGCFKVTGLPTGVYLPVFVTHASYHNFVSEIYIDPTVVKLTDSDHDLTGPLFANNPQTHANVNLWPLGIDYSYMLHTTWDNRGVEGIEVRCVLCANNTNDFDALGLAADGMTNNFLTPHAEGMSVAEATSDSNGIATLAGSGLVKGGYYACFANGKDNEIDGDVYYYSGDDCSSETFIVGQDDSTLELSLSSNSSDGLFALWSNIDDADNAIGATGSVVINLNRAAQVVSGTTDCQAGSVAAGADDGSTPDLVVDVDDDNSESISVSLDAAGMVLTVTPNFLNAINTDRWVNFTFGGIFLQPTSGLRSDEIYHVGTPASVGTGAFSLSSPFTANDCASVDAADDGALLSVVDGTQATTGRLVN